MANLKVYGELHLGDMNVMEVYLGEECVYEFRHLSRPRKSFGGLHLAPGPMYLDTNTGVYSICSTWDQYNSYGQSVYVGGYYNIADSNGMQTYFSYSGSVPAVAAPSSTSFGCLFDSTGSDFTTTKLNSGSPSIDNLGTLVSWDGDNDWRLPTVDEQKTIIFGQTTSLNAGGSTKLREGSTVNGYTNVYTAFVRVTVTKPYGLTETISIGSSTPFVPGLLIFPDNKTITGATVSGTWVRFDSSSYLAQYNINYYPDQSQYNNAYPNWSKLTEEQLNEYILQGCVFMPLAGRGFTEASSGGVSYMNTSTYSTQYVCEIWPSTSLSGHLGQQTLSTGSFYNYPYTLSFDGFTWTQTSYGPGNGPSGLYMLYLVRDNN